MGIACLARYLADGTGLVRLDPPSLPPPKELWLVVHADMRHVPRMRALSDFLTATEARCRQEPGFKAHGAWQTALAELLW